MVVPVLDRSWNCGICGDGQIIGAVQSSPVPWLILLVIGMLGEHEGWFSRDPVQVFSAGGPCEQFWHGQGCPFFDVVCPAFPLPTTASPTLQGALKDGFGEAVVACDVPNYASFPLLTVARSGSCKAVHSDKHLWSGWSLAMWSQSSRWAHSSPSSGWEPARAEQPHRHDWWDLNPWPSEPHSKVLATSPWGLLTRL